MPSKVIAKRLWKYALTTLLTVVMPLATVNAQELIEDPENKDFSFGNIIVIDEDEYDPVVGIKVANDIGTDTFSGTLQLGNLTVKNTSEDNNNDGAFGMFFDLEIDGATLSFGTLKVFAASGDSYGIAFAEEADVILKSGNITVTAEDGDAIGIGIGFVKGGTLTIADNVSVFATTVGIGSLDDLKIVLKGGKLTANSMFVDGDLIVAGKGFAHLGTIDVGGDFSIGSGNPLTVAVNLTDSFLHDVNIENNANIWLYGDVNSARYNTIVAGTNVTIRSIDPFFNYDFDGSGIIQANRDYAYMSDGFLAATGIHNRYAAWSAVRDRMISSFGYGGIPQANQIYRGQMPRNMPQNAMPYNNTPQNMRVNPTVGGPYRLEYYDLPTVWANYVGRNSTSRSAYNGQNWGQNWKLSTNGVQTGADIWRNRYEQVGILFGYEGGKMTNAGDRIDANDYYLGAYAACVLTNDSDIRAAFAFGWQDYKMNRLGVLGLGVYDSSFKGNTSEFNVEVGKRLSDGPGSLRPVLGVDVLTNNLKGASENGGSQAVVYDKTSLTQVFLRTGAELRYQVPVITLNGGIYYAYDMNSANLRTYAKLADDPTIGAALVGTKPGRSLLLYNVGGSCQVTDCFAITAGYEGQAVLDGGSNGIMHVGHAGGALRW
jgi:hypothetical protein